jgi:hypothetical protein
MGLTLEGVIFVWVMALIILLIISITMAVWGLLD